MRPVDLHPNQPTLAPMMSYEDLLGLKTLMAGDEKHELASESTLDVFTLDVLWVLYDRILKVDPQAPDDPDRDPALQGSRPDGLLCRSGAEGVYFDGSPPHVRTVRLDSWSAP